MWKKLVDILKGIRTNFKAMQSVLANTLKEAIPKVEIVFRKGILYIRIAWNAAKPYLKEVLIGTVAVTKFCLNTIKKVFFTSNSEPQIFVNPIQYENYARILQKAVRILTNPTTIRSINDFQDLFLPPYLISIQPNNCKDYLCFYTYNVPFFDHREDSKNIEGILQPEINRICNIRGFERVILHVILKPEQKIMCIILTLESEANRHGFTEKQIKQIMKTISSYKF